MSEIRFTFEFNAMALKAAVREVAAESPDFVYKPVVNCEGSTTRCRYTEADGSCGCIIGHGVYMLTGAVVDEDRLHGSISGGHWERALHAMAEEGASQAVMAAYSWLCDVQSFQDGELPWGQCVQAADEETQA